MSQDYTLPTANSVESTAIATEIVGCLNALRSLHSGASAPSSTVAYMLWADTSNGVLKLRNAADSGWITLGPVDEFLTWRTSSVLLTGGLSASDEFYIDCPESTFYVQDLVVTSDTTTSGSDGSNNWAFQLANLTATNNLKATAYDTSTDAELTADAPTVIVLDQNQTISADDQLEVQVTKTGTPTDLSSAQLMFQIRGYHT